MVFAENKFILVWFEEIEIMERANASLGEDADAEMVCLEYFECSSCMTEL